MLPALVVYRSFRIFTLKMEVMSPLYLSWSNFIQKRITTTSQYDLFSDRISAVSQMVRPIKLGNAKFESSIHEMSETFSTLEKIHSKILLGSGADPFLYAVTPAQIRGTHHFHF